VTDSTTEVEETLAIPLADLRPALEAVLMVADQPLDELALATTVGYPVAEVTEAVPQKNCATTAMNRRNSAQALPSEVVQM